jgi:heat shock protein HtpX
VPVEVIKGAQSAVVTDVVTPDMYPNRTGPFRWRWLDRRAWTWAYRATLAEFRSLEGAPSVPAGRTRLSSLLVSAAAVLILLFVAAVLVAGVWLCTVDFPGPALLLGAFLILLAVAMRPRLGRLPKYATTVTRDEAPALYALVDRVAEAAGAPTPHVICLEDDGLQAYSGAYGLRRRRLLGIGLPLWQVLTPQQRVALLGHEIGHFVNGDVRRSPLVSTIFSALDALVSALTYRDVVLRMAPVWRGLVIVLLAIPRWLALGARIGLHMLVTRVGQRAEYRADALAADLGGSAAAVDLTDLLLVPETVDMLVKRDARAGRPPSEWAATAAGAVANARLDLAAVRERNLREETSIFASHPPAALRGRLIEARSPRPAAVDLDEATAARIEEELAKHVARSARTLKSL